MSLAGRCAGETTDTFGQEPSSEAAGPVPP
jgi:hypothetical protein